MLNISIETTTTIYYILNGVVSAGFMFLFLEKLYVRLYENSKIYVGAYFLVVFVNFIVAMLRINIVNSIVSIISIIGFVTLLYNVKRREAIIHSTAYMFGNVFAEVISLVVVSSIVDISLFEILNGGFSMYLFSLINWIFLFVNYKFFSSIYKNKELSNISRREFVFFIVITLTEIYITTYILSEIDQETSGLIVMVILSAFFGFNIYVEYLLNIVNQANEFKLNLEVSQQQNKMQLKYYEDLMQKQEQAQQIIHDVKKHIMSLEALVEINEKEQAQNYSNELYERLDNIDFVYKCSNKILNIIMNDKMHEAKNLNINFTVNIEDVSLDFFNDLDVTTIFANLLDNAFEENNQLNELTDKSNNIKWVKLSLQKKKNFILICITNPVFSQLITEKGKYKTNKQGHKGIGLINVTNALQQYNGDLLTEIIDGNFVASITIPI